MKFVIGEQVSLNYSGYWSGVGTIVDARLDENGRIVYSVFLEDKGTGGFFEPTLECAIIYSDIEI